MYARRYAQAQNETASPERLMVLLFETALRHIRSATTALEQGRARDASLGIEKAALIVGHLDATFDRTRLPELGANLGAVYAFTNQRLLAANLRRDPNLLRDAERAFAPVADGFTRAVEKMSAGRAP